MLIPISDNKNYLFYGDNLDVLRQRIPSESVDLCYIDPPFNSKRTYFQIYNNIGHDDVAQAQAFMDTWQWGPEADRGFEEILTNADGRFSMQTVTLIQGYRAVLGAGGLLAYLVHMALRITEIHRVLKPVGSFYLHCDPTASHYLKLILDAVFVSQGGHYTNEIAWCYGSGGASHRHFSKKHDTIFFYHKSSTWTFNVDAVREPYSSPHKSRTPKQVGSKQYQKMHPLGRIPFDWWEIPILTNSAKERLGYPTQKPESLLERIIQASSNPGDTVLDAYCGCGTTVAVSQRLGRRWFGIDITYQAISLILKRLEDSTPPEQRADLMDHIVTHGIPKDLAAAEALAHDPHDKTRKEFEKWAILTYTRNRARIHEKKGADRGIDGWASFVTGPQSVAKVLFQAKSGKVNRATVATLRGDMAREGAALGVLLTLKPPTKEMLKEATTAGTYTHPLYDAHYPVIEIVPVQDLLSGSKVFTIPMTHDAVKSAQVANAGTDQLRWM